MIAPRRRFLTSAATLASGALILPRFSIGRPGPPANSRLNLAFIGVGGRGAVNIQSLASENVVALCDVDETEAAPSHAAFPQARRFKDFREMLDKMGREIDAVVISTPDHTHFAATMASMELGKHVLCEKPLTHSVWEARTLKAAARHYKVTTQMGNQGHATEGIRYMKEWFEAGVLGRVTEVHAWLQGPNFGSRYFARPTETPPAARPVPAGLDWDLWLGPIARDVAYNPIYVPKRWRGFYEFGGGLLGDWSCHTLDGPFWALGLGQPTRVEAVKRTGGDEWTCPEASVVRFEFPARGDHPPVVLTWHDGGHQPENRADWGLEKLPDEGMIMAGDQAILLSGTRPDSPRLIPDGRWQDFRRNPPPKTIPRIKGGHYREWTDAIKGDGPTPGSNFDYAAELTEMLLLGVLAQRFGGHLDYDDAAMKIRNRPELDAYLKPPVRNGWEFKLKG